MRSASHKERDSLLIAAGAVNLLSFLFGLGTIAFSYDPGQASRLFWFGPILTFVLFFTVLISRKVLAWSMIVALLVTFIGSLSAMTHVCNSGDCLSIGHPIAMRVEIAVMAMFTPQTGLSLIITTLVLISNRNAQKRILP